MMKPQTLGGETYRVETESCRADVIREMRETSMEGNFEETLENVERYAEALAEHALERFPFLVKADLAEPIDTSERIPFYSPEKPKSEYANLVVEGFKNEQALAEILTEEIDAQNKLLKAYAHIFGVSSERIVTLLENYEALNPDEVALVGSSMAFSNQFLPVNREIEIPYTKYRGPISRYLLHKLNRGLLYMEDGTIKRKTGFAECDHPLEIYIGDTPVDPMVPIETWTPEIIAALKELTATSLLGGADTPPVSRNSREPYIYAHGSLNSTAEVTVERLKIIAETKILNGPVVIHLMEGPSQDVSRTKDIVVASATLGVPVVIETNKFLVGDVWKYHTGKEYQETILKIIDQILDERANLEETKRTLSENFGLAIDFAHLHCAHPLGKDGRGKIPQEQAKKLTLKYAVEALETLEKLEERGIFPKHLVIHLCQNDGTGIDNHLEDLESGTVPLKECYKILREYLEQRESQPKLIIITEQSGPILPGQIKALQKAS